MSSPLSSSQVTDLAKRLSGMADTISQYYKDPAHEKAFQDWSQSKHDRNARQNRECYPERTINTQQNLEVRYE